MFRCMALVWMVFAGTLHAQEKSMVVVIPSYNNAQWYKANLDSVCFQNYNNYRIIYIDDCSTDGTARLVQAYIDEHDLHDKVKLVCNKRRKGAMANHYYAVWMCDDDDIIVHLDGDDWLKHNDVLSIINNAYQDPYVWLTYGQFERYPDSQRGYCRPTSSVVIARNAFREIDWVTSHLRTFYAGLFKQIKVKDFIYQGSFFNVTCDMAMFFPLLELAATHILCIEEVLYVYNEATNANDYKMFLLDQLHCDKVIRSRTKYQAAIDYHLNCEQQLIDVVIFLTNTSLCKKLLHQLADLSELVTITVVYKNQYLLKQSRLEEAFPEVVFKYGKDDLFATVDNLFSRSGYLLCIPDTVQIVGPLLLDDAINALEQTKALSFHLHLAKDVKHAKGLRREQRIPPLVETQENVFAWQYKDAEFDWKHPYGVCCLYAKEHVKRLLQGTTFKTLDEYVHVLQSQMINYDEVGLCFERASIRMCNNSE